MSPLDKKKLEPWEELSSETAFESQWYKIVHKHLKMPDGIEADYYIHDSADGVICVCLTPRGKIILERQYRPPIKQISVDYPAGGVLPIDEGDPEKAMRRELSEELGFVAQHIKHLGKFFVSPGHSSQVVHVFVARGDLEQEPQPEDTEKIVATEVTPEEILDMIGKNLLCSICVSATFLAFRELGLLNYMANRGREPTRS